MRINNFLLVVIFLLCGSDIALPQSSELNPFSGTLNVNVSGLVTTSSTDYHNSKIGLGISFGSDYFLPLQSNHIVGIGLEGNSFNIKGTDERNSISTTQGTQVIPGEFITSFFNLNLYTFYSYQFNDLVFPFIGFGAGYNYFSPHDKDGETLLNSRKKKYKKEFTNILGLIGMKIILSDKISTNIKVEFFNSVTDNLDDIQAGSKNDFFTSIYIGLSYNLFGNEDSDEDGLLDKIDFCPDQAEDLDGFLDGDGCPDIDNDNDNIPDSQDQCPNQPEDFDGYQDTDGCPDFDNDGDKILDELDLCPNEAEDFDFNLDTDGCPDEDNDGDGILDIDDGCPNTPETFNNFEDEDGCPDSAQVSEKNEDINQILLEGDKIFSKDGSEILLSATEELDQIVEILKKYPDVHWRIEGHMDSKGSEQSIRMKSTQRADSIFNYFVSKGLDQSRFQVFGMGDKFPIANNTTELGRKRNRRILIIREK